MANNGTTSLASAKIVPFTTSTLSSGENDFYTCPANKRAVVAFSLINLSGGSITETGQLKVNGVYYTVSPVTSLANNTSNVIANAFSTYPCAEAGEGFSVLCTGSGLTLTGYAIEFDATEPFKGPKIMALASGDNTLYTAPAGKSAIPCQGNAFTARVLIFNGTAGTRTYSINVVPRGSSPSTSNQGTPTYTATTGTLSTQANPICGLNPGDFLSVNSDSSLSGQVCWTFVLEHAH